MDQAIVTRPKIPAEATRAILIESGHRCAVCGEGCPLERAHIIPWCKSKEHKIEDLICLCANCHQRADQENWGAATLREYKLKPWILRRQDESSNSHQRKRVQLSLEMDMQSFDERTARLLVYALAAFLEISPGTIKVCSVEEGSVKVILELPHEAADKLIACAASADELLSSYLKPFGDGTAAAAEDRAPESCKRGMTCHEVNAALFLFFDGELEEELLVPFRDHVSGCEECAKRMAYTRKLLLIVREKCTHAPAPRKLLTRVIDSIPHAKKVDCA